jgi:hypothetical protein
MRSGSTNSLGVGSAVGTKKLSGVDSAFEEKVKDQKCFFCDYAALFIPILEEYQLHAAHHKHGDKNWHGGIVLE